MVAGRPSARGPLSGPDAGLFGPASLTWRLDREAFLLMGAGPRALLLQIAHPAVAAGVDQHSDFRADPWTRLAGTLRSYLRIVYGTTGVARAEIRRLNRLHGSINGPLDGGGTYEARDPALALWVHATLVDSTMTTFAAWLEPLDRRGRAQAYAESLPVGRAFGIPLDLLPRDIAAFDAYVETMIEEPGRLAVGPLARELAGTILHPPLGPAIRTLVAPLEGYIPTQPLAALVRLGEAMPPSIATWLMWPSIGLLPPAIRNAYGLGFGGLEHLTSAWLVRSWRAWAAILPPAFRQMPQARAADRRMATASTIRS